MSMPSLPEDNIITREEAVNLILTSIGMEEVEVKKSLSINQLPSNKYKIANAHFIKAYIQAVFYLLVKSYQKINGGVKFHKLYNIPIKALP